MNEENFEQLKKQMDRIERCLIGDENMGQQGLVATTRQHDRRISALERAGLYVGGAAAMVGLLWTVWTQWPRK